MCPPREEDREDRSEESVVLQGEEERRWLNHRYRYLTRLVRLKQCRFDLKGQFIQNTSFLLWLKILWFCIMMTSNASPATAGEHPALT